jgi:hypothetical protein
MADAVWVLTPWCSAVGSDGRTDGMEVLLTSLLWSGPHVYKIPRRVERFNLQIFCRICLFGLFASSVLCSRQSEGEHFLEVNIFKTCIGKLYPNDCVSPWMFRTPFEVAGTPHA